jgi:hypothetical protein
MGIAHALFGRERAKILENLKTQGLHPICIRYRDFLAYPATGGFSHSALLPAPVLHGLLAMERLMPQAILRFFALRMIVVLEKTDPR